MESHPPPPFRSFSTNSPGTVSLNSSSSNITRVALGPLQAINVSFNKQLSAQDHLFYQCVDLKNRLLRLEGMQPFLDAAFASAELCSEQQALALSQQLQQDRHDSFEGNDFRASVNLAGFSIHSDASGGSHPNGPQYGVNNNILTFTAGVLPAKISVDPATQMWKLFQQGSPLCLVFNHVSDENHIPIISSSDLRVCKKAVYDFLIAVKMHLHFDDDIMFTISNVFLDNTHDLLRIIRVVNKVLDLKSPSGSARFDITDPIPGIAELTITDDRSKVFKEIIETERKYVQDLELLLDYRNELLAAELVSSEQLHVLFPNLSEIVDFQRRFLNGLECNINIPTAYQRIGSVFIHAASGPFKAYEPWTIGQLAAIELINKEAANLKKSSSLLDPGFELQSYIIKPIQRLCKYPLLLKELIKTSPDVSQDSQSVSYNELVMASSSMKEVANQVNEAQRRSENVGYLQSLVERVHNWRGFNLKDQGELLYHGIVGVKDSDSEKEYAAYLFEKIIFFFVENNPNGGYDTKSKEKKKREILSGRKKSSSSVSSSTANLLESLNHAKDKTLLELKGRVYILEIYNILSSNLLGYTLVISWSGKKESGSFTLRYRTEESRNQWENCLRNLKTNEMNHQIHKKIRDSHGSLNTNDSSLYDVTAAYASNSPQSSSTTPTNNLQGNGNVNVNDTISFRSSSGSHHFSSSSTFSIMRNSRSKSTGEAPSRVSTSSTGYTMYNDTTFLSAGSATPVIILIRLVFNKSEIPAVLTVPSTIQFQELHLRISSQVANSDVVKDDIVVSKLKYKDEDGDFVVMDSNDDWLLAIDMLDELPEEKEGSGERHLTMWVS